MAVGVADGLSPVAGADLGQQVVDVTLTVASLTTSRLAISALDRPSAISPSTSASRGVRPPGTRRLGGRWRGRGGLLLPLGPRPAPARAPAL